MAMLFASARFRLRRQWDDEVDVEGAWPFTEVALILSYHNDQMPASLEQSVLTGRELMPNSRPGVMYWSFGTLRWLFRHLVETQGGIEVLRSEVARYTTTEDPPLLHATIYSVEEAQRLVQFVDELESKYHPYDPTPVLLWFDTDYYLCISRKPPPVQSMRSELDIDGHNWTLLLRSPPEPD